MFSVVLLTFGRLLLQRITSVLENKARRVFPTGKKNKTKCQHHSFHFAEKHTQRWTLSGQVDNRQQSWVRFAP